VKVSIITAVFNRKNTISRCVESVLAQSYPNIEYIIVDGGSNDGTLDALASFKNGIDVFVSEKDHGLSLIHI
jgi:glycosyltransferase involved in cell wall biosynthesis